MDAKKMYTIIREKFHTRIERKTGWGKNEIKTEFELSITEALLQIMDEEQQSRESQKDKI